MKILALLATLAVSCGATAQTFTTPDQIAGQIKFWAVDNPVVYYGQMQDANEHTLSCLEIAFIKYENGVFQYAHKMWSVPSDRNCGYNNFRNVADNITACVADSERSESNPSVSTRHMSPANIDIYKSIPRIVDTNRGIAGEVGECTKRLPAPHYSATGSYANILDVRIEDGHFKLTTNGAGGRIYRVDLNRPYAPETAPSDALMK